MALPSKLEAKGFQKKQVMTLPTTKTTPPKDISSYSIFLYGKQKTGKTSFTAQFENALHFFFEPSGTDYELYAVEPRTWDEFTGYIDALEKSEHEFKTFVVDVVDLAYEMCSAYVCKKNGVTSLGEIPWGQGWTEAKTEFRNTMQRLAFLGGLVCVSHAKEQKVESRKGDYDVICPTAANGCKETLSKWADLTAYYAVEAEDRKLYITPSVEFEAGNRMESRFKDPKTGEPLQFIPMGKSAKEAFKNFMLAFKNQLEAVPTEEEQPVQEPTRPARKTFSVKK